MGAGFVMSRLGFTFHQDGLRPTDEAPDAAAICLLCLRFSSDAVTTCADVIPCKKHGGYEFIFGNIFKGLK